MIESASIASECTYSDHCRVFTNQVESSPQYVACLPSAIRPGQLLEVQVAFCAVPVAKGKYRMLLKLRSVCILDRQVQKVCSKTGIIMLRT